MNVPTATAASTATAAQAEEARRDAVVRQKWLAGVPANAIAVLLGLELTDVFQRIARLKLPMRDHKCRVLPVLPVMPAASGAEGGAVGIAAALQGKLRRLLTTGSAKA